MSNSPLRRSGMARVNEGSHSFTCHPHVYPQIEWTIPAFTPQPHSVTEHFGLYSFSVPTRVKGWVGLSGWSRRWFTRRQTVTHPSTNRRRVTSLIETNALPLSQAAGGSGSLNRPNPWLRHWFVHVSTFICQNRPAAGERVQDEGDWLARVG